MRDFKRDCASVLGDHRSHFLVCIVVRNVINLDSRRVKALGNRRANGHVAVKLHLFAVLDQFKIIKNQIASNRCEELLCFLINGRGLFLLLNQKF